MTIHSRGGASDLIERLSHYQSDHGLSQQEIAEQAGVSQSVVSKILRQGIENIRASTVRRIEVMLDAATNVSSYENVKAIGDILFAEQCLRRGVPVRQYLPFEEQEFLEASVKGRPDGNWEGRFYRLRDNPNCRTFRLPEQVGPCEDDVW